MKLSRLSIAFLLHLVVLAILVPDVTAQGCLPAPTGLVSWWRAESNGADAKGANAGSPINGVSYGAGNVGQSFNLNGTSAFVDCPSTASLTPTGSFTIEAWIFPRAKADQAIYSKWGDGGNYADQRSIHFSTTVNNALRFWISDAANQQIAAFHVFDSPANAIQINTWSHVAAVYDKLSGTRKLYVNGVQIAERSDPPITILNTSVPVQIGAWTRSSTATQNYFNGLLDEVSFYSRALSTAELQAIFSAGSAGKCTGSTPPYFLVQPAGQTTLTVSNNLNLNTIVTGSEPIALQWFKDGGQLPGATSPTLALTNLQTNNSGTYVLIASNAFGVVASSNAILSVVVPDCVNPPAGLLSWWSGAEGSLDFNYTNHGVLQGGAGLSPGWVGQAFNFGPTNQYLEIPHSSSLVPTGSFSIEAWIYPRQDRVQTIMAKWGDAGDYSGQRSYWFSSRPNKGLRFSISDATRQEDAAFHAFDTPNNVLVLNAWNHVAAVYDKSTGARRIFVNGAQVAERIDPPITIRSGIARAGIGAQPVSSNTQGSYFDGLIDEISFYSRALTSTEVQQVYASGYAGKCKIHVLPVFTIQPADKTLYRSNDVAFISLASGTSILSYQWQFNGVDLPGATNSVLKLLNVQPSNAGVYSVVASNTAGAVISSNATLTVNIPTCASPDPNMLTWWPGEGNSNDILFTNTAIANNISYVPGKAGQAFNFNGTNSALLAANAPNLNPVESFTIECWIFPRKDGHQAIVSKWGDQNELGDQRSFHLATIPNRGIRFWLADFNHQLDGVFHAFDTTNGVLTLNAWNHIAAVYDQPNGLRQIFVNGLNVGERTNTPTVIMNSTGPLSVGAWIHSSSSIQDYFDGIIDEISLYGVGLSPAGIQAIYGADSAGKCPIPTVPSILVQPKDRTIPDGHNSTVTIVALGSTPLAYQWRFNGIDIPGATTSAFTINNAQTNNSGQYSVIVTNVHGSVSSSNAFINVVVPNCVPMPSSLLAWWTGNGTTGEFVSGYSGLLKNGAGFADGVVGDAFNFNGTNQYVEITNGVALSPTGSFTIEAWIYPRQDADQTIFSKWGDVGDYTEKRSYQLSLLSGKRLRFAISDAANQGNGNFHNFDSPTNAVQLNTWNHVVAVYNQAFGMRRLYVNGERVAERIDSPISILPSSIRAAVGARFQSSAAPTGFFNGLVDEISLYGQAFSDSQIQSLYQADYAGKCQVPFPPTFAVEPVGKTVTVGYSATFTSLAIGTGPVSYQWRYNGMNLQGANSPTLLLTNVQTSHAGNYSVVVSNVAGFSVSSNAVLAVNVPVCAPLLDGLAGWWPAQGSALDSAYTNNGTLRNGTGFGSGIVGKAFNLNGLNQSVEFTQNPGLHPSGSFTIEGWIYPRQDRDQAILGRWGDLTDYSNQRGYLLSTTTGRALRFWISDTANQVNAQVHAFTSPAGVLTLNAWNHVAAVYDRAAGVRQIYVNGIKVAEKTGPAITVLSSTAPMALGGWKRSSTVQQDYFDGLLDEISFYNRALMPLEVQGIFNADNQGKCPSPAAPLVVLQPSGGIFYTGAGTTLNTFAIGAPLLSYQWRLNGTDIPGATSPTLALPILQLAHAGNYSVVVTNQFGAATSSDALVNVLPLPCTVPTSLAGWWPAEGSGNDINLTNNASITDGVTFAPGLVGKAFNFSGVNPLIEITNGTSLSPTGSFSIEAWVMPDEIASQTIFSKWGDVDIYANRRSYQFNILQGRTLRFWISDSANQENVSFHSFDSPANVLTLNAWNHVAAVYDQTSGTRQIYVNGVKVAERTQPPISILGGNMPVQIGSWRRGSNSVENYFSGLIDEPAFHQKALSSAEVLALSQARQSGKCLTFGAPSISQQSTSRSVTAGSDVSIFAAAVGMTPLAYQWQFAGTDIAGATTSLLTLTNFQSVYAGNYNIIVTNVLGAVTSSIIQLAITEIPPVFLSHPANQAAFLNDSVAFSASSIGSQPISYQWLSNNIAIPGEIGSSLTLTNVQNSFAGNYSVVAANMMGSVTSSVATLTLVSPPLSTESDWPIIKFTKVTAGVTNPTHIANAGDGSGRMFAVQQAGQIRILQGTNLLAAPFLDIADRVLAQGERGLLSVVFSPGFVTNKQFYVNYTSKPDGSTVVSRFLVTTNANVANPSSEQVILTVPQPYANHNGGQLAFGPDGFLYIGMGDGGSQGDPQNYAQTKDTLLGKILRIDVESVTDGYAVPTNNPFVGQPEYRPEIWALGLRNPWRFSFDRLTGDMFIADVGQYEREEINFQPFNSPGGENYGWNMYEGLLTFIPVNGIDTNLLTMPVAQYPHSVGQSVTGGHVVRGTNTFRLKGNYFYGDFITGRLWALKRDGTNWQSKQLSVTPYNISTFGEDEPGNLYLASYFTGEIYKVEDSTEAYAPALSLVSGSNFSSERLLTLSSLTPGVSIHYTLDGSTPTVSDPSVPSGGSILISSTVTLRARAFRPDLIPSAVTTATYNFYVSLPGFDPAIGPITNGNPVRITNSTPGTIFHYTLDGSDPTTVSPVYSGPLALSGIVNVKAIGFKSGSSPSAVQTIIYGIRTPEQTMVSTLAGTGSPGFTNGPGNVAQFSLPQGLVVDAAGNVFVADSGNHSIRKINPAGQVSTLSGTGSAGLLNGPVAGARFSTPVDICVDTLGNLYVVEKGNKLVRKISTAGTVSTIASGFSSLENIEFGGANTLYVSTLAAIKTVSPSGQVAPFAGTGVVTPPWGASVGLGIDPSGNVLATTFDSSAARMLRIDPAGTLQVIGVSTKIANDGPLLNSGFLAPTEMVVDRLNNVYVIDASSIRKIRPNGMVTTLAGSVVYGIFEGPGSEVSFGALAGIGVDNIGNVYVSDAINHSIRKIAHYDWDEDGIPDAEEGGTTPFVIGTDDRLVDSDGDGITNAAEFLAGTNPLSSTSYFVIKNVEVGTNGAVTLSWDSVLNRSYQLMSSSDLLMWTNVGGPVSGNGATVFQTDPDASQTQTQRFYRVQIRMP